MVVWRHWKRGQIMSRLRYLPKLQISVASEITSLCSRLIFVLFEITYIRYSNKYLCTFILRLLILLTKFWKFYGCIGFRIIIKCCNVFVMFYYELLKYYCSVTMRCSIFTPDIDYSISLTITSPDKLSISKSIRIND